LYMRAVLLVWRMKISAYKDEADIDEGPGTNSETKWTF